MGVGDLLEYRQSLQNYAASFPESERASQFEQVASSQLDVVAVIDRWNAFLDRVDAARENSRSRRQDLFIQTCMRICPSVENFLCRSSC